MHCCERIIIFKTDEVRMPDIEQTCPCNIERGVKCFGCKGLKA